MTTMRKQGQKGFLDDDGNLMPIVGDDDGGFMPDPGAPGSYGPDPEWGAPPPVTTGPGSDPYPDGGPGGGGGSGLPSWLTNLGPQFLRLLGLGGGTGAGGAAGGAGGSGGLLNLLGILAGGYGAYSGNQATHDAADAMREANTQALDFTRGQLGAGDERMRPYTDMGQHAVWNLGQMGPSPLAGRYKPLGTGRGMTLGTLAKGR